MSNKKNVNKNIEFDVVSYLKTKSADPFRSVAVALRQAAELADDNRRWKKYKETGKHIADEEMNAFFDGLVGK